MPKHDLVLKDTEADKRKLKLRRANQRAYCELMLACQGISFALIKNGKSLTRNSTHKHLLIN